LFVLLRNLAQRLEQRVLRPLDRIRLSNAYCSIAEFSDALEL
jgi:hypothetical protein